MALVRYNAKNVYSCCGVRLLPGINKVRELDLTQALTVPLFQWRIDKKIIEVLKEEVNDVKEVKQKNSSEMEKSKRGRKKKSSNAQIISLMAEVYDVKLLKEYMEHEDPLVVKEAEKQLEKIKNVPVEEQNGVTIE